MRYNEWLEKGCAVTYRNSDPFVNTILLPVKIKTLANCCNKKYNGGIHSERSRNLD